MAEDFTLLFLAELVVGLSVFCLLSAYAYRRIKRFKKDVAYLTKRLDGVETSLRTCRSDLHAVHSDSDSRLSQTEMEQALSLFSMHVLHHLPGSGPAHRLTRRRHPIKSKLLKR